MASTMTAPEARTISLVVASALFMLTLDGAIITTSLPQIARSLDISVAYVSIGITAYILATAAFLPLGNWMADRFGARTVLAWAVGSFTIASLVCGGAHDIFWFVAARAAQGMAAGLILPVGRIIVLRDIERHELIRAQTFLSWPVLIAPVLGPPLGGLITQFVSWRANFFINIPIGAAGLVCILRFIRDSSSPTPAPFDWRGLILSSGALTLIIFGLGDLAQSRADSRWASTSLCLGALAAWFAVVHFRRIPHPLLDLGAVRSRTFRFASLVEGTLFRIALNSTPFLMALLFQLSQKRSVVETGILMLIFFAGNLAMKAGVVTILSRVTFRAILFWNGLLLSGCILCFLGLTAATPQSMLAVFLFVAGMSRSLQFSALSTIAFADIEVRQRAAATTLSEMMAQLASGLGIALSALVLYRSASFAGRVIPSSVDFDAAFMLSAACALVGACLALKLDRSAGHALVRAR